MRKGDRIARKDNGRTGTVHLVFPNGWLVVIWDVGGESGCWMSEVEKTNQKRFDYRTN